MRRLQADVVVIGGGMAGDNAAAVAWGMGAHVTVLDHAHLGARADHFAWMKQPQAVVDALLDQAWADAARRSPPAASQAFSQALQHYRSARAEVLQLARQERFDDIRRLVPEQVRPAYDRVKDCLGALARP